MKKFTLLLAALVLLSSGVFAVETALAASIEGDATMTFGMNLETGASGIRNATSGNLKITIVPKATEESEAVDGVYGWIKLKDFQWNPNANDGANKDFTAPGVEARIIIGPAFINILGAANNVNYASLGMGRTTVNKDGDPFVDRINILPGRRTNGVSVGADLGVVKVEAGVSSRGDWAANTSVTREQVIIATAAALPANTATVTYVRVSEASTGYPAVYIKETRPAFRAANTDNEYNFWGMVGLTAVEGLTLDVKVNYESFTQKLGLGARAGYKLMLDEMFLQPMVGFDFDTKDPSKWELGAGLQFSFGGADIRRNFFGANDGYDDPQTIRNGVSVGLLLSSETANKPQLQFTFFDGALIPIVDVTGIMTLVLEDELVLSAGTRVSADLGVVVPFTEFFTTSNWTAGDRTYLAVGTDVKVIPNTVFTLQYANNTLARPTAELGTITFATKISF